MNSDRSVEISIATLAEEAGEATKLEYLTSGLEKRTAEKVADAAKGEAAKDFKICTYTKHCQVEVQKEYFGHHFQSIGKLASN